VITGPNRYQGCQVSGPGLIPANRREALRHVIPFILGLQAYKVLCLIY
jgi:hypothetical protein